jgi:hypothetical protein
MRDYQSMIFNWASAQDALTALVIFALGLCYALHGFRFQRALLAMSSVVIGCGLGATAANWWDLPAAAIGLMAGGACGLSAMRWPAFGLGFAAFGTFATIGHYLAYQLGMPAALVLGATVVGALGGLASVWLYRRPLPMVLTAIHGSGLMVVGFVGLMCGVLPAVGSTFVSWSSSFGLLVPVILAMLVTTGLAYQSSTQFDLQTGAGRAWNQAGV